MPATIAETGRHFRSANDIGEQNGGQDAVWFIAVADAGEKLLNFAEDYFRIAQERDEVTYYDGHFVRALTSSLSCRTISIVLRKSASLRATPMVDAIEMSRASSLR